MENNSERERLLPEVRRREKALENLSSDDLETLKIVATYWKGIKTFSSILTVMGRVGQALIYLIALYLAIKSGFFTQFVSKQ